MCPFDGVYQPLAPCDVPEPHGPLALLSYLYDRIHPLLPPSCAFDPISPFSPSAHGVLSGGQTSSLGCAA